jgi:hypothetical protein
MDGQQLAAIHERFVDLIKHLPPAFQDTARQKFLTLVDHLNPSSENLVELFELIGLVHFAGRTQDR